MRSVFSEEKKLSIAALSQTLPSGSSSRPHRDPTSASGTARGVLAAAIGVMQQRVGLTLCARLPSPTRRSRTGCHLSTHRPADRAPGEQVDDGGHSDTLRCPDICEVGNPFAVGSGRFEAAVEYVGSDGGDLPLTQSAVVDDVADGLLEPVAASIVDLMQATRHALGKHVVPHPPGTIGSIAGEEAGTNLRAQLFIAAAALTARPC